MLSKLSCLRQFLHVVICEQPCLLKPLNCMDQALCDGVVSLDGFNKGSVRAHLQEQRVNEELVDDAEAIVEE